MIITDDPGGADLSSSGAPHISTPDLDRLATQGVRFTDGYAGSATCSPTRISLYTGRNPGRLHAGLSEPIAGPDALDLQRGIPPQHPTMASLLRSVGYATGMVGKWRCGSLPNSSPLKSGGERSSYQWPLRGARIDTRRARSPTSRW